MATNQYLPFAIGGGANTISAAAYQALAGTVVSVGFQPGPALSEQMNTVLRQTTVGIAALAALAADFAAYNMMDDSSVVNFRNGLKAAIEALSAGVSSPAGAVVAFARPTAPAGWLECNGAPVSRTTYAALFASIGTTWGVGDGSTTFNLPNFAGEFLRGWDHGRGVDAGRAFGSFQADEIKSHTHTLPLETGGAINQPSLTDTANTDEGLLGSPPTGPTGGSETRPRNYAVLYCIKT